MNCIHSFRTEIKLKFHEHVCKNKDSVKLLLSSGKNNILEFNQQMKIGKMSYIIYADIESLIKKIEDVQTMQRNLQQQN